MKFGQVPGTNQAVAKVVGSAPAGRPTQVTPKYSVRPQGGHTYAWTMSNTMPDLLKQVNETYLKDLGSGTLPPALQPRRSPALQAKTNQAIQQGWQKNINGGKK